MRCERKQGILYPCQGSSWS